VVRGRHGIAGMVAESLEQSCTGLVRIGVVANPDQFARLATGLKETSLLQEA